MATSRLQPHDPANMYLEGKEEREDWEDWEEDEPVTPGAPDDNLLQVASQSPPKSNTRTKRQSQARASNARQSAYKIKRLKSRQRQKAQNAKAGIRLVTDMSKFRKGGQHIAHQLKAAVGPSDVPAGKFVDAAALRALEGEPSSASTGNWAWLKRKATSKTHKKKPSQKSLASRTEEDLSPNDRPIVIGIAMPEDDLANRTISPQTAVVRTPLDLQSRQPVDSGTIGPSETSPQQLHSVWSPDTPDTENRFSSAQSSVRTASMASAPNNSSTHRDIPPVPAVPSNFKSKPTSPGSDLDDDGFTPITLFEEDGSPVNTRKSPKSAAPTLSPETTRSRSGWWDHVRTPFTDRGSPFSAQPRSAKEPSPATEEWWADEKPSTGIAKDKHVAAPATPPRLVPNDVPIIRVPTPTTASSGRSTPSLPESHFLTPPNKTRGIVEEDAYPTEEPPPYTPPSRQTRVRYRAVFPPGHPLANAFPPSPGPASPFIAGTMTSQGAIAMTEVPLTPLAAPPPARLPDRAAGTYVTGEHFAQVTGRSPAAQAERRRRRHEKEDYIARKIGGFWRGRGCIPESGCFGRSGREGRKRRRIWLAACGGILALVLIVVLAVTLSHKKRADEPVDTVWLNLTGFPPIPTGVSTVVGTDNSVAVSGCTVPSTLWTCSLPKEQHADVTPFQADQPRFIFQIQFDNSTRQLWNVTGQEVPHPAGAQVPSVTPAPSTTTSGVFIGNMHSAATQAAAAQSMNSGNGTDGSLGARNPTARARAVIHDATVFDTGFVPNPVSPSFQEMWFLGNTTDGIVSDEKAGEPTPFFITFFRKLNQTVGPNVLSRRKAGVGRRDIGNGIDTMGDNGTMSVNLTDILPPPDLNPDGTGAPAQLLAYPVQQPLRLFDRGLPTEHYGFYSYYNKTTYVKSTDRVTNAQDEVPADQDGGCFETEANFLVTWAQSRFVVKIWTRMGNSTRLLGGGHLGNSTTQPGTFPYPITVGIDQHGGDNNNKGAFFYGVDNRQHIDRTNAKLITNNIGFDSPRINPGFAADPSLGGIDGGTGGCRCAWQNFLAGQPDGIGDF